MKKMYEILNKPLIDGLFGVEIECEGNDLFPINTRYWRTESDGSLRGQFPNQACEWVMKKPLSFDATVVALKHLLNAQKDAKFNFSIRTSVHVHVNVLDLTWDEYMCMVYLYMLLEEPMMRKCGNTRIANRFCLRVQDAEGILDTIEFLMNVGEGGIFNVHGDQVRYAALNIAATCKYGSLEFRGMEGNLDIPRLTEWLTAINSIKEFAKEFGNVKSLFRYVEINGAEKLLDKVLGKAFVYEGASNDIQMSHSLTRDIPYLYKEPVEIKANKADIRHNEAVLVKPLVQAVAGLNVIFAAQDANMFRAGAW